MRRFLQTFLKARIGNRALAVLCCFLVLLSLLPLVAVSFYNHPYYDDFSRGGQVTKRVWEETHSVGALLLAAADGAKQSYFRWEGNYVPNYLNCIQLSAISQELCFAVTVFLLLSLAASWAYLCKVILSDVLGAPAFVSVIGASMAMLISVHFVPYANEAFFWQSGGIKYTLGHAFLALLIAWMVKVSITPFEKKRSRVIYGCSLCISAFLCAGSNLMTGVGAVVALVLAMLYFLVFARENSGKMWVIGATVIGILGFAVNVLAPGNGVRQGDAAAMNPALTVVEAVYATIEYIGRWTTLPWIAMLALLAPFVFQYAEKSRCQFRHPILLLIASFGVLASQLAPPIYTNLYYDSGRIVNTMYLSYCLWMVVNGIYLLGWLAKRHSKQNTQALPDDKPPPKGYSVSAVIVLMLVFFVGCAGYGLTKTTGGASAKALISGQAARYDAAYRARTVLLEDAGLDPVSVVPMEDVPLIFMDENYSWRSMLTCLSQFYGKDVLDGR